MNPHSHDPKTLVASQADEARDAEDTGAALDPLGAQRLQQRARGVLARAARLQDLHGQAYDQVRSGAAGHLAPAATPQALLEQYASGAIVDTLTRLHAAAAAATQMAATDGELARLERDIHGTGGPAPVPDVIDVQAVEVTTSPPRPSDR